jgi:type I site-specific restriction-modification system R (restriction) subunit
VSFSFWPPIETELKNQKKMMTANPIFFVVDRRILSYETTENLASFEQS